MTRVAVRVIDAWSAERDAARAARESGDVGEEWRHLERAHILSQAVAGLHVRTHLAMAGAAIRARDLREFGGQVFRLVVAASGSWTGRYPRGNPGSSRVSAFVPMEIPEDLARTLERTTRP